MTQEDSGNGTGDLFSTTPAQTRNSTPIVRRLVEAAAGIMGAPVPTDRDRAFLARPLVQATLPHFDPGDVPVWTRTNGRLTLVVRPYYDHRQCRHFVTRVQQHLSRRGQHNPSSQSGACWRRRPRR